MSRDQPSSLTRNQLMVLDELSGADKPLSAYALLDRLGEQGIKAPVQVYRALERLQKLGLVHRLESVNAFVACNHPHQHQLGFVAFAICELCEEVEEFSDAGIEHHLRDWAHQSAFTVQRSTLEIHGRCRACAKAG